jgi:predicted metallo-beta-lactamase superfamily hydrolase
MTKIDSDIMKFEERILSRVTDLALSLDKKLKEIETKAANVESNLCVIGSMSDILINQFKRGSEECSKQLQELVSLTSTEISIKKDHVENKKLVEQLEELKEENKQLLQKIESEGMEKTRFLNFNIRRHVPVPYVPIGNHGATKIANVYNQ